MKWLTESNAIIDISPDPILNEDMVVQLDCEINGNTYCWGNIIPRYKCSRCKRLFKMSLQEILMEAELAFKKTKDGLDS